MGSLHAGHMSLIEKSLDENDSTLVSLFVNPLQFNDKNDYQNYPVDLESDLSKCEELGVTAIFAPDQQTMYAENHCTYCNVPGLENTLCGASRPDHFKGVCTIVLKLFNIIRPTRAYFGQKDFQQSRIIQQMVSDLNVDIHISVEPTIRENTGLAMSSRNELLNSDERNRAGALYKGLKEAKKSWQKGERKSSNLIKITEKWIKDSNPAKVDYISVVKQSDLQPTNEIVEPSLIAVAVYYGNVRLIDNILL